MQNLYFLIWNGLPQSCYNFVAGDTHKVLDEIEDSQINVLNANSHMTHRQSCVQAMLINQASRVNILNAKSYENALLPYSIPKRSD